MATCASRPLFRLNDPSAPAAAPFEFKSAHDGPAHAWLDTVGQIGVSRLLPVTNKVY